MSKRFKTGAYGIGELVSAPPSHCTVTKDISEIFKLNPAAQTEGSIEIKPPKLILIEGAPGIGKTILATEIAHLWANHNLLKDYKLVILVYLRDPKVHTMKSVQELIQLYTNEKVATEVSNYLEIFNGQNVAFVFDGFDEFPISQESSIVTDIIGTRSDNVRKFCKSTVVVTSRSSSTLILRKVVDKRLEILGFTPEEFGELVSHSALQFPDKRAELEKYLKGHPVITGLCYSPLNVSIILYLFYLGNLPKTLTEINDSIVVHMVYQQMIKTGSSLTCRISRLKDMPKNIYQVLHKLSKLAFDGLHKDQFVFTYDKLKDVCPEICDVPEAANGFSLLQAVQLYSQKGAATIMKFNFLNLTMQNFLATYYVSSLPEKQQLELLQTTFWDGHFNFMWMMYVGIVGIKSVSFASFLGMKSTHEITVRSTGTARHDMHIMKQIENMRRLHLFQCYMEAKADAEMPREVSTIFSDGTVSFMDITLCSHHVTSLLVFMFTYSTQQWKSFTLNKCNLQRTEINILLYNIINNKERMSALKYVDLSENGSSPWGLYSIIIRHSSINSLELCGDKGMKEYIKEITDSLQANATIQSLTLFSIGKIGVESIKTVLMNSLSLKRLTLSWQTKNSEYNSAIKAQIHTLFSPNTDDANDFVNVNTSYDIYVCYQYFQKIFSWNQDNQLDNQLEPIYYHSQELINKDDERINDDAVHVLVFGLCNNTSVKQLSLSNNSITDEGAVAIIECLKHNNIIKKLDLSYNRLTMNGMNKMLESIEKQGTTLSLEYVDLSKNGMSVNVIGGSIHHANSPSPWAVYSAIIRHCCSNSLTLCGENGMEEYIKEITDSLQANTTLQSLTLFDIGTVGVQSIKAVLMNKSQFTLKTLNLSLHKTNLKTLEDYTLLHKLSHNTNVAIQNMKEHNHRGIRNVILLYNIYANQKFLFISFGGDVHGIFEPKSVDLTDRLIFGEKISLLAFGLCDNTIALEELNISDNFIKDEGVIAVIDLLKYIKTLKKLDLSKNMITVNGMNEMLNTSERIYERFRESHIWTKLAKPYKKLRCYSLSSSDVSNGKITLVVNISEKDDGDHLATQHQL